MKEALGHVVAARQRGYPTTRQEPVAALEPQAKAWLDPSVNHPPHRNLPRLLPEAYRGRQFVHWTMSVKDRQTGWLTADFHTTCRGTFFRAAASYSVVVPAYCLMPDHLHLLATGVAPQADQQLWARSVRRRINEHLAPYRLQKQAYDHVLRPSETRPDPFAALVHYLIENPVRAGLAPDASSWPYTGACVPDLHDLDPRQVDFPERWWHYWAELPNKA